SISGSISSPRINQPTPRSPMSRSSRAPSRLLLALATLLTLLAVGRPALANNCANGGGARPDEGGIGGTGMHPAAPHDADGGTGISAPRDSGVIGTITGFGSICVGGLEIHYAADTPVQKDGRTASPGELAVGEVVEVVASGNGDERRAEQITVRSILSGPVT